MKYIFFGPTLAHMFFAQFRLPKIKNIALVLKLTG